MKIVYLAPAKPKQMEKKEIIDTMLQVAMSAINHVNGNPEGFYPKECDCDSCERKRICEAIEMLQDVANELKRKI